MQPINAKPNIDVPAWVQTPDSGMGYFPVLTELTNPTTGETWTAPHSGYSVKTPATTNYASPRPSDQTIADTYAQHTLDSIKYGATHGSGGVGGVTSGFFRAWDNIQNPSSHLNNKLFNRNTNTNNGIATTSYRPTSSIWQSHLAQNKPATTPQFTAQSMPSLMSATAGNRTGQPYMYGNLGLTSSDYSLWGSKGNPYYYVGNSYNPANWAHPVVPQPVGTAPVSNGGGDSSDYSTSTPGLRYGDDHPDAPFYNTPNLHPILGVLEGRVDNPFGEGYARLPWYEGSAGGGYGYTEEGYDQYAPGDSDRGIYDAATGERTWGDEFDDYNTGDTWAYTGFAEGMSNLAQGKTWDGLEKEEYTTPKSFADPNSATAIESDRLIQEVADQRAIEYTASVAERQRAENPAQAIADANYVGTAADGYAATAERYGTTPGSEQTAMLAEQDMGVSSPTVADSIKAGVPFGQEGDDTWSPNGQDVYHGSGHNWNTPDSKNTAPVGTKTAPVSSGGSSDDGYGDSSGGGGGWEGSDAHSDMDADSGWSGADSDFDDDSDSGGGDSGGGGGGGSYIATAATQALGEDGLKLFEDWRDYMFTALPTFTTSYGRYRVTAPKIVAKIDAEDNSKELYKEIWDKHLKPIFDLIKEDKDNPKALSDYKIMVKELINKYLKGDK